MSNKGVVFQESDQNIRNIKLYYLMVKKYILVILRYQQYKDRTPLKLYSNLDHNDPKRRELYYKRHPKDY
jgi:hypothetical protein